VSEQAPDFETGTRKVAFAPWWTSPGAFRRGAAPSAVAAPTASAATMTSDEMTRSGTGPPRW